jgi:hypothetical protein
MIMHKKVKWLIAVSLGLALVFFTFSGIVLLLKPRFFGEVLEQTAVTLNKKCPCRIDEETQMDSVSKEGPRTLHYYYTLVHYEAATLDTASFRREEKKDLVQQFKTSPELKVFRDNKAIVIYHYSDKQHVPLCTIAITPDLY